MMRGRSDGSQKKRLITSVCVVAIFLGFLYAYYGSIFGHGTSALEYGSKSLKRIGSSYLGGDDESDGKQDEAKFGQEDEDDVTVKSFPVSYLTKLALSLMIYMIPQSLITMEREK